MRSTGMEYFKAVCLMFILCGMGCRSGGADVFSAESHAAFRFDQAKGPRYLLYDVNPGEGFNLRRDVYIRIANLVKFLNEREPWVLVLPPWGRLYHWQSYDLNQEKIPWSHFFDLDSLRALIPVIEYTEYLEVQGSGEIEQVLYLQRYKEGWQGKWEEKMDERDCIEPTGFVQDRSAGGHWHWWFWGYPETYALNFTCLSIQAQYTSIIPYLTDKLTAKSVFIMRGEQLIHGEYSEWSPIWWTARRSMRFSQHLRQFADKFRQKYLSSTDAKDKTKLDENWQSMKRKHGDAIGGPYLAVHVRRKDFARSHVDTVPSLSGAAAQISSYLEKHQLDTVYIATDAPYEEYTELAEELSKYSVYRFEPTERELAQLKDGGVAVIDQWICAHARVFVGTAVSTFSFRIHEEREILGFKQENTFNCFCGDEDKKCEQPSKWSIMYS